MVSIDPTSCPRLLTMTRRTPSRPESTASYSRSIPHFPIKLQAAGDSVHAVWREPGIALPHQQHTESRKVVGKDAALAVQDAASGGDDREIPNAVALRLLEIDAVLSDLEPPIADQQYQ